MRVLDIVAFGLLLPSAALASVCKPAALSSSYSSSSSASVVSSVASSSVASSSSSAATSSSLSSLAISSISSSSSSIAASSSSTSSSSPISSSVSASSSASSSISSSASISSPAVLPSSSSASSSTLPSSSSSSSSAIPACSINAIANSDFSEGVSSDWTPSTVGSGKLAAVYDSGNTKPYYLSFTTTSTGLAQGSVSQQIDTVVGEIYSVTLAYEIITRSGVPNLSCSVNNVEGTIWTFSLISAALGQWTMPTVTFVASSAATTLTCKFSSSLSLTAYLTDIDVHQQCT